MSEEQSSFKVTDRRLFNPDGTPREIEPERETAQPASAPAQTPAPAAASAEPEAAGPNSASSQPSRPAESESSQARGGAASSAGSRQQEPEEVAEEGDIPGADDPASFINFLMSIASNAAAALGMMEHPVTGERGVDLPLGKHWVDVLGMLQEKTQGNLSPQEQQIFTGLLSDLRMQYLSLTRAASSPKRSGFTGRDILGGK